jgi:hypothetical protein
MIDMSIFDIHSTDTDRIVHLLGKARGLLMEVEGLRLLHKGNDLLRQLGAEPMEEPPKKEEKKYDLAKFMEDTYPTQKRITLSDIATEYKKQKGMKLPQDIIRQEIEKIGYKVSNCSHKLIAIKSD